MSQGPFGPVPVDPVVPPDPVAPPGALTPPVPVVPPEAVTPPAPVLPPEATTPPAPAFPPALVTPPLATPPPWPVVPPGWVAPPELAVLPLPPTPPLPLEPVMLPPEAESPPALDVAPPEDVPPVLVGAPQPMRTDSTTGAAIASFDFIASTPSLDRHAFAVSHTESHTTIRKNYSTGRCLLEPTIVGPIVPWEINRCRSPHIPDARPCACRSCTPAVDCRNLTGPMAMIDPIIPLRLRIEAATRAALGEDAATADP